MDKPLSEMTIEELVGMAWNAGYAHGQDHFTSISTEAVAAEARRRDAAPTAWPTGPQAAEQLARAIAKAERDMKELDEIDWGDLSDWVKLPYRTLAAAVLARLGAGAQEPGT